MINKDKEYILKIQTMIDMILESQNMYAVDRDLMIKLDDFISENNNIFNEEFATNYLNFIDIFSQFFDMLLDKLKEYEEELFDLKELVSEYFFVFNFDEFKEKEILMPYFDMINYLEEMFPKNRLLQGIIFYIHLNALLKRYKFTNNKIRMVDKLPVIDIDYGSRIAYFKEEYITAFRHELEEGIRNGVFLEDDEIIEYVKNAISDLENEINS